MEVSKFGFTPEQSIHQNFMVFFINILSFALIAMVCGKSYVWSYPLNIGKIRSYIAFIIVLVLPIMLDRVTSPTELFYLQALCIFFSLSLMPMVPIFISYLPILKRCTFESLIYVSSRVIVYVITSFGLVYLIESFGQFGLWFIMIPVSIWHN